MGLVYAGVQNYPMLMQDGALSGSSVVTIVGSAGGIPPLLEIVRALPADFPAPVLVVQHSSPQFPSRMPEMLRARTSLRVKAATDGDALDAGTIYVAANGRHLVLQAAARLSLSDSPRVCFVRPAGDLLFLSAAIHHRARTIAVVLSGRGQDGSVGVRSVKGHGGVTIVQEPETCEYPSMPVEAVSTGCVDFVLSPAAIADALIALVMVRGAHAWFHRPAVLA